MFNPLEKLEKLLKSQKRLVEVAKAPYALVNQLSLEGRLHKTKVLAIFDFAEDAYGEAERLGLMAIHVPTLAHIGKVIFEVDIGKVYPVLRKYAVTRSLPGLDEKWKGWSCVATSRSKATGVLAKVHPYLVVDEFFLEEIDS